MLLLLVGGTYFMRIDSPSLRGEESRRAQVAREMLASGDWAVPQEQGEPYLEKPPLHNWVIALTSIARGALDPVSIRLPSVIAILVTALLVYTYTRSFLTPLAALTAGGAFATMGQVLQLGRLGETDALFTLLVSSSLLIWHLGYSHGWGPWIVYGLGYGLTALATLTKGPQAPLFFLASTTVYLLIRGDRRFLLAAGHLFGLAIFAVTLAAWHARYHHEFRWAAAAMLSVRPVGKVFSGSNAANITAHLLTYPLETILNTLPWSLTIALFLIPEMRRFDTRELPYVQFLVICLLVSFPICWLPPHARGRYYMPLYPLVAVLVGIAAEHCSVLGSGSKAKVIWNRSLKVIATVMLTAALAILIISLSGSPRRSPWAQPPAFAAVYMLVVAGLAYTVLRASAAITTGGSFRSGMFATTIFLGFTYTGVVVNELINDSVDTQGAVAQLLESLPPDARLVSLGHVHHLFAYYYQRPIRVLHQSDAVAPGAYFCFDQLSSRPAVLPFAWKEIKVISVSRSRSRRPQETVVIGRRE